MQAKLLLQEEGPAKTHTDRGRVQLAAEDLYNEGAIAKLETDSHVRTMMQLALLHLSVFM